MRRKQIITKEQHEARFTSELEKAFWSSLVDYAIRGGTVHVSTVEEQEAQQALEETDE